MNARLRFFAASLLPLAGTACGDPPRLASARVLDGQATLTGTSAGEHAEGSFVVEVTAASDNDESVDVVVGAPSIHNDTFSIAWTLSAVQADTTEPLSIPPGESDRLRVTFTADALPPFPTTPWSPWCSQVVPVPPAKTLQVAGEVFDGVADMEGHAYSGSLAIDRDTTAPEPEPPASGFETTFGIVLGGAGSEELTSLAVNESAGILVTGISSGMGTLTEGTFVAKLSPSGELEWAKPVPRPVVVVAGGDATFIVGSFAGMVTIGGKLVTSAGDNDVFAARLDANGDATWARALGDGAAQFIHAAFADDSGALWLAGNDQGKTDFGGGPPNEGSGATEFVVALDPEGQHLSTWRFPEAVDVTSLAVGTDGAVALGGWLASPVDLGGGTLEPTVGGASFVAVFEPDGLLRYDARLALPSFALPEQVAIAFDGDELVVVVESGAVRFRASGAVAWSQLIAPTATALPRGRDVAIRDDGNILIVALGQDVPTITQLLELEPGSGTVLRTGAVGCASSTVPNARLAARPGFAPVLAAAFEAAAAPGGELLSGIGGSDVFVAGIAP